MFPWAMLSPKIDNSVKRMIAGFGGPLYDKPTTRPCGASSVVTESIGSQFTYIRFTPKIPIASCSRGLEGSRILTWRTISFDWPPDFNWNLRPTQP
jgi:hypothetical protein